MINAPAASAAHVLLVTRRFWPLTDDAAGRLITLAEGLRRSGVEATILAARFASSWPTEFTFREVPVVRPLTAPRGDWSGGIYQRGLLRWLREQAEQYDVIYADCMREEGAAVVEAGEQAGRPTIVRCGGCGGAGDWIHAARSRTARRSFNTSLRASALIAPHVAAERALIASGADRGRIHRINDGIPPAIRRDGSDVAAARAALASINGDLYVPNQGSVVLICTRLSESNGIFVVADAIAPLCEDDPTLRVWFVGEGPQREQLHHFLSDRAVRGATALPGSFWHIDELMRAANLMIVPSDEDNLEHRLSMAIAAAVPVAMVDTPVTRGLFADPQRPPQQISTFSANDRDGLRQLIRSVIDAPIERGRDAIAVRNRLRRQMPREHSIEAHGRLINQLRDARNVDDPTGGREIVS
jgi:glycosyltransferase involved in cell wall biosynthesis